MKPLIKGENEKYILVTDQNNDEMMSGRKVKDLLP